MLQIVRLASKKWIKTAQSMLRRTPFSANQQTNIAERSNLLSKSTNLSSTLTVARHQQSTFLKKTMSSHSSKRQKSSLTRELVMFEQLILTKDGINLPISYTLLRKSQSSTCFKSTIISQFCSQSRRTYQDRKVPKLTNLLNSLVMDSLKRS